MIDRLNQHQFNTAVRALGSRLYWPTDRFFVTFDISNNLPIQITISQIAVWEPKPSKWNVATRRVGIRILVNPTLDRRIIGFSSRPRPTSRTPFAPINCMRSQITRSLLFFSPSFSQVSSFNRPLRKPATPCSKTRSPPPPCDQKRSRQRKSSHQPIHQWKSCDGRSPPTNFRYRQTTRRIPQFDIPGNVPNQYHSVVTSHLLLSCKRFQ